MARDARERVRGGEAAQVRAIELRATGEVFGRGEGAVAPCSDDALCGVGAKALDEAEAKAKRVAMLELAVHIARLHIRRPQLDAVAARVLRDRGHRVEAE